MRSHNSPSIWCGNLLKICGPIFSILPLVVIFGLPAAAQTDPPKNESPAAIAEQVLDDGVYIAATRQQDEAREPLVAAVLEARVNNIRVVVVLPESPEPDAESFARRVQERTDADVAIVFPKEGRTEAYAVEELTGNANTALNVARSKSDPAEAVRSYVGTLTEDRGRNVPLFILGFIIVTVILVYAAYWASSMEQQERHRLRSSVENK